MMACTNRRLLAAFVALAACNGDEVPVDDDTGTSGGTTMEMTTASVDTGDTAATEDTMADPTLDSSSTMTVDDTTTDADDTTDDGDESSSGTTGSPNLPPVAHHDPYVIALGATDITQNAAGGVLTNDRDPEDDALSVTASDAASAQGGAVSVDGDGDFVYTAVADYWGEDSFAYSIEDTEMQAADGVANITVRPQIVDLGDPGGGHYGFRIDGTTAGVEAGEQVANAGDVDGDGLDDIVIASTLAAGGVGRVWVVFGKTDGTTVDLEDVTLGIGGFAVTGDATGEDFGFSVGAGGDVNGDGLADIIIGAPGAALGGAAYVVLGKADGDEVTAADIEGGTGGIVLTGTVVGDDAGTAVAIVGDVNGDGLDDIAVGAPRAGTVAQSGRTYIVFGLDSTAPIALGDVIPGTVAGFVINGEGLDDLSGSAVSGGGDANDDGLDDIVIGAPEHNTNGGNAGAAYVVFGKTTTSQINLISPGAAAFAIHGIASLDLAAQSVGFCGDVNGDGFDDVLVGASGSEDDLLFQGRAFVVHGKDNANDVELSAVLAGMGGFAIDGEAAGHLLGQAVASAGDVDGDGFADLVLGSQNADFVGTNAGRAYVVFGKTGGAVVELANVSTGTGGIAYDGESSLDRVGASVAGGGDIDGDGYRDLIVAAPESELGAAGGGSIYVLFGASWQGRVGYVGGPGDDDFVGAPANEGMVGGLGNDTLFAGGGSDVLAGGACDDTFLIVAGQFFRIDGGSGTDTLAFADADTTLTLSAIPNAALSDIEIIDLGGTGDNTIILVAADVRSMVGASKTLTITGDMGDAVDITLPGWTDEGTTGGFEIYTQGIYRVEVSEDLDITVSFI